MANWPGQSLKEGPAPNRATRANAELRRLERLRRIFRSGAVRVPRRNNKNTRTEDCKEKKSRAIVCVRRMNFSGFAIPTISANISGKARRMAEDLQHCARAMVVAPFSRLQALSNPVSRLFLLWSAGKGPSGPRGAGFGRGFSGPRARLGVLRGASQQPRRRIPIGIPRLECQKRQRASLGVEVDLPLRSLSR
jgi:hypothetical protein